MTPKTKKILIITIVSILAVLILVPLIAYLTLSAIIDNAGYSETVYIHSPDGKYTLIIKEKSYLMAGTVAEIYGVEGSSPNWIEEWLAPKLGETFSDDGVSVFDGKGKGYKIEWLKDEIVIRYYSGRGTQTEDPATWDIKTLECPDNTSIYLNFIALLVAIIAVITVATKLIVKAVRKRKKITAKT